MLLLPDVQLGRHEGRKLNENLKSMHDTKNIPLVLISMRSKLSLMNGYGCKPDDFIKKTFEVNELVKRITIQTENQISKKEA
ncbi:hypothetical protein [Pedobacter mendelii]|uniref:Response regulatory domain-containing protein n=1 Tax=Pedobacter mendelii TaxID=1908240 RepID=A0ABQ2BL98_9SPHI|nr:hypothetical protein [Pedobacter mendelii]GGI28922.1 hypothetical protein GCM10008119_35060 [Pedobacter mendelii]